MTEVTNNTPNAARVMSEVRRFGYWRVLVRPQTFERRRIQTITDCFDVVQKAQVRRRGWPYPAVSFENKEYGEERSTCSTVFNGKLEVWHYFQSGQFLHVFAMREDTRHLKTIGPTVTPSPSEPPFLSWVSAVYSVAEIVQFCGRLALQEGVLPSADVSIQLHGCRGRWLGSFEPGRELSVSAPCMSPVVEHRFEARGVDLVENEEAITLRALKDLFAFFNWKPDDVVLKQERHRLLDMRTW